MKKSYLILFLLLAIVSFGFVTQTMANDCGTALSCGEKEDKDCDLSGGVTGKCVQLVKDGPGSVPDGCYCRAPQIQLRPIWIPRQFGDLTLSEAYQARTELDQLQDDLDDRIIDLESQLDLLPVIRK